MGFIFGMVSLALLLWHIVMKILIESLLFLKQQSIEWLMLDFLLADQQSSELDMEDSKWEYPPFSGAILGRDEEGNPLWQNTEKLQQLSYEGPSIETVFPVTESQKEIWLSCFIGGEDANRAYNESVSVKLEGQTNIEFLKQALVELVNRHEALRSAFSPDGKLMIVFKELGDKFKYTRSYKSCF